MKDYGDEIRLLKERMQKMESLLGKIGDEKVLESVDDLFKWQQRIPRIKNYDIWSITLTKKVGTDQLKMGTYAGGEDYTKIQDLSPEDAANLAGALSHPARVLILKECEKESKYPSDLEKTVTAKYGALYHHMNSLIEANLVTQEKERGKYVITSAGKTALLFLNVLASVIESVKFAGKEGQTEQEEHISGSVSP